MSVTEEASLPLPTPPPPCLSPDWSPTERLSNFSVEPESGGPGAAADTRTRLAAKQPFGPATDAANGRFRLRCLSSVANGRLEDLRSALGI